jgi:hypothetical protein
VTEVFNRADAVKLPAVYLVYYMQTNANIDLQIHEVLFNRFYTKALSCDKEAEKELLKAVLMEKLASENAKQMEGTLEIALAKGVEVKSILLSERIINRIQALSKESSLLDAIYVLMRALNATIKTEKVHSKILLNMLRITPPEKLEKKPGPKEDEALITFYGIVFESNNTLFRKYCHDQSDAVIDMFINQKNVLLMIFSSTQRIQEQLSAVLGANIRLPIDAVVHQKTDEPDVLNAIFKILRLKAVFRFGNNFAKRAPLVCECFILACIIGLLRQPSKVAITVAWLNKNNASFEVREALCFWVTEHDDAPRAKAMLAVLFNHSEGEDKNFWRKTFSKFLDEKSQKLQKAEEEKIKSLEISKVNCFYQDLENLFHDLEDVSPTTVAMSVGMFLRFRVKEDPSLDKAISGHIKRSCTYVLNAYEKCIKERQAARDLNPDPMTFMFHHLTPNRLLEAEVAALKSVSLLWKREDAEIVQRYDELKKTIN